MGPRFWIKRFLMVYVGAFLLLALSEYFKGHHGRSARGFSSLWALISASIFIATRIYHARRGRACAICKDTPE